MLSEYSTLGSEIFKSGVGRLHVIRVGRDGSLLHCIYLELRLTSVSDSLPIALSMPNTVIEDVFVTH